MKILGEEDKEETEAQVQATAEAGQEIVKEEAKKEAEAAATAVYKHKQTLIQIVVLLRCRLYVNLHANKMSISVKLQGQVKMVVS